MDFIYMFKFYIACLALNVVALPLCYKVFGKMRNGGMFISKSLGLYITGYVMWLLSSLKLLKFSDYGAIISFLIALLVGYCPVVVGIVKNKSNKFVEYIKSNYKSYIICEIVFILVFVFINWIFAHRIPGSETERMMDLGFMNSLYMTEYMPPKDMWAAGSYINYYYFGQYIITFLTKLSFIPVGYGYTFGLFLIISWGIVAVFCLVYSITDSRVAGVLSSAGVFLAGNMHYVVFGKIVPMIWDVLQLEGDKPKYWFANSTRYIGYVPEMASDKTIHEFPSYSFIVGDLHAHVVNLLVVIVILSLLWCYLIHIKETCSKDSNIFKVCINPYTILIAFLLGICSMSNYWDLPIYYVVSGSIILFGMIYAVGLTKEVPIFVGLTGIFIYILNLVIALPFNLKFEKMIEGIGIVEQRSLFYQYLLLWGFPVILAILFFINVIRAKKFDVNILYITMLLLCAIGLTLIPELVFVKDIYIDGFPRANTMFKLSYEAFVMFGIGIGCVINHFYKQSIESEGLESYRVKKISIVSTILLLCTCCYSITAVNMWISDFSKETFRGFDAASTIKNNNFYELDAIDFLVEYSVANEQLQPTVLEADGDSYTNTCRVSVLTGFPTVLGWHTHEWLWHNSYNYMEKRRMDVEELYSGEDVSNKKLLVQKYDIDYIYIGLKEYSKYEIVQNSLLEELGEVIFCEACDSGEIIEIIKVAK